MATFAHDAQRRALLRGAGVTTRVQRPPWALAEARFIDACTRCGDCVGACPEQILRIGDGGYPRVDRHAGECTFCGDCVRACTAQALDARLDPPWDWRAVIHETCLRNTGVVCESCRDICAHTAIRFGLAAHNAAPHIDHDRCTGCNACIAVCPGSAIGLRDTSDRSAA